MSSTVANADSKAASSEGTLLHMVPGPTRVARAVREAYLVERGSSDTERAEFAADYRRVQTQLAALLNADADGVVLMVGEGMLALWAALKSVVRAGDTVVALGGGIYGDGIGDMAESIGAKVVRVSCAYDSQWSVADAEAAIESAKPVLVTAVHCETPSGVLRTHLDAVGAAARRAGALFYVDCVSSAGGAPVDVRGWSIDLALLGAQKAFGCPPSLSALAVSARAWQRVAHVGYVGYDALAPWRAVAADGALPPYTFDWHALGALEVALRAILDEGAPSVMARHAAVAAHTRAELRKMGLRPFAANDENASPTVTAFVVPDGFTWPEFDAALRRHGVVLAGSFGELEGKVARIGHMGTQCHMQDVDRVLEAIKQVLAERNE